MNSRLRFFRPHRNAKTLFLGDAPRRGAKGVSLVGAVLVIFVAGIAFVYGGAKNFREPNPENKTDETNRTSIDCTIPSSKNTQSDLIQIGGIRSYRAQPQNAECDSELIVLESLDANNLWKKIGATEVTPID